MITVDSILKVCPQAKKDLLPKLVDAMNELFPRYEITGRLRIAAFIAQTAHESDRFQTLCEYGGPSYFKKYNGRKDLGNTQPGDGPKFKGRGLIQTTGRDNYTRYGKLMGLDLVNHPELLEEPYNAVWSACLYWQDRKLNAYADSGNLREMTRRINGRYNGYEDRKAMYEKALKVF